MTKETSTKRITNTQTGRLVNTLLPLLERKYRIREQTQDSTIHDRYQPHHIRNQYISRSNIGYIESRLIGLNTVAEQINDLQSSSFQCPKRLSRTFDIDIKTSINRIIEFSYANSISRKYILEIFDCKPEPSPDTEEELELDVIRRYMLIPQVMLIYTDEYQEIKRFLVCTSNKKYDDSLMRILLSNEYEIRLSFTSIPFSFEYIPHLADVKSEIVPQDAKLIYQRDYDVILTGPYMASWSQRKVSKAPIQ